MQFCYSCFKWITIISIRIMQYSTNTREPSVCICGWMIGFNHFFNFKPWRRTFKLQFSFTGASLSKNRRPEPKLVRLQYTTVFIGYIFDGLFPNEPVTFFNEFRTARFNDHGKWYLQIGRKQWISLVASFCFKRISMKRYNPKNLTNSTMQKINLAKRSDSTNDERTLRYKRARD